MNVFFVRLVTGARFVRRIFPLVVLGLAALARAADDPLQKRFAEANARLEAHDFRGALTLYNEIIEAEPKADNVLINRAITKWNLDDRSGARADIAQALSLSPRNGDAYVTRARFRFDAEDLAGSIEDYTRAIELSAADGNLYLQRASVLLARRDYPAALEDLSCAIERMPRSARAFFLRAQIYEQMREASSALADYARVIELEPADVVAHSKRAWLRFELLQWDAAISGARKTSALAPKVASALRLIGFAQFAKGDNAEAAKTLAAAADLEPGESSTYPILVRHFALQRAGGSDERLATASATWKDAPWPQAIARFILGQATAAELEAEAAKASDDAELSGRACELHFYVGLQLRAKGDVEGARRRFQQAWQTDERGFVEYTLAQAELQRP